MAIYKNTPPIVTNGLVLALHAANLRSYIGDRNILNPYTWTVSSGSIGVFNQNGVTSENRRLYATDPFGKSSVVWGSYPLGENNNDGGWDSANIPIDPTQMYRFSVWVKRISNGTSGNFYLGTYGANLAGSNIGVAQMFNDGVNTNPYWDIANIGTLTKDVWFLVVGHIYPQNTTYTGKHPDSGVYTVASGSTKVRNISANIGTGDVKWITGSAYTRHRTYHYYSLDSGSQLQFFDPRIDLCNGTQPSISDLVTDRTRTWYDISGNLTTGSMVGTGFDNNKKCILFASSSNSTCLFNNQSLYNFNTGSFTIESVVRLTATASGGVNALWQKRAGTTNIGFPSGYQYRILNSTTTNAATIISVDNGKGGDDYTFINTNPSFPYYTFIHSVVVFNSSSLKLSEYRNGVLVTSEAQNGGSMTGSFYNNNLDFRLGKNDGNSLNAEYYTVRAYNRVLSSAEVTQNYNATKARFGL